MIEGPKENAERPSMTEAQVLEYFREIGMQPLPQDWKPHQSVIYVLEEEIRLSAAVGDEKPSPSRLANLARIDDPLDIVFSKSPVPENRIAGAINNEGGQVDYYAIDPVTRKATLVRTSKSERNYFVLKRNVFAANDDLFPKSREERDSGIIEQ